jgi:hypothetical protein
MTMNIPRGFRAAAATLALASAMLVGCVVSPAPAYYGETVQVAPPAPQVEVVGVAPAPGYVWLGGYWGWSGGRYAWNAGHWEAGRPGYHWVPHRWVAYHGGYRMQQGHWAR